MTARRILRVALALGAAMAALGHRTAAQDAPLRTLELVTAAPDQRADTPPVHVVALHPWGGSARAFARSLAPGELRCRARWTFVEGPHREPPGRAWFLHRALDSDQAALAREVRTRADELARSLATPESDPRPNTIIAGYSEGAMLALAVGALHPESADAIVAASGALPRTLWPASSPPAPSFAIVHGRDDPFVPFPPTETLARRLGASFLPVNAAHRFRGPLRRAFRDALRAALARSGACAPGAG